MSADERSVEFHQSASTESANFDRFVLGASMAACAYLAQTMPFGPIGINVSTMHLATLLIMALSTVFGFLRIEATITTTNANSAYLHGIEMGMLNDLSARMLARKPVENTPDGRRPCTGCATSRCCSRFSCMSLRMGMPPTLYEGLRSSAFVAELRMNRPVKRHIFQIRGTIITQWLIMNFESTSREPR